MADKGSVTSRIFGYIRDNIQSGQWTVGEKIPSENQMCRELGVSRVSVRKALQQFVTLGVLNSVRGKGTFLISDDLSMFPPALGNGLQSREALDTMLFTLEFRGLVEPVLCAKAAENATPELIASLTELVSTMQNSIGCSQAFVEADVNFHLEICRACGNPVTMSVMNDVFCRRPELGHMLNLALGYYGGIYYHTMILSAIKQRDGKRAHDLMEEHLQRGIYEASVDNAELFEPQAEAAMYPAPPLLDSSAP